MSTARILQQASSQEITPIDPFYINAEAVEIRKYLGKGHFAKVFSGYWNGMKVAIKRLNVIEDADRQKFNNEKDIMQELSAGHSSNIIKYYGYFITEAYYSIVMEEAFHGSLEEYMDEAGSLKWIPRLSILSEIAHGMEFLHDNGVIHCDLNPANVFLDANCHAKIGDFGLARKEENVIHSYYGSLFYKAPELLTDDSNSKNSKATDVFAFAVILCNVAGWCRASTFPEMNTAEFKRQVVSNGLRQPISPTCPDFIVELINCGWAHNPQDRPTAKQYADKIDEVVNSLSM